MANVEFINDLVSRKDAIANGLKFYFTGKPCKFGHIDQRRLPTNRCKTCEYESTQKWRKENREHVRARDKAWKQKNKEHLGEKERARYAANPEKFREKSRKSYWRNPEEYRVRSNKNYYELYKRPEIRLKAQERSRKWALDNPERAKVSRRNAKVKRRNLDTKGSHTESDISDIFKSQKGKCAYCRVSMRKKYTVDHIIALAKGGTNDRRNIQLTCMPCNREKWARDPLFHARMLGKLL